MSKETVAFACRKCEHKIHSQNIISPHPPACECGAETFPHSHRGAPGNGGVIRHRCAFCDAPLAFDTKNRRWTDRIAGTSFRAVDHHRTAKRGMRARKRSEKEILRRAFARVSAHKMTPEGRIAMRIVDFLRAIAANAAKAEEAGEPQTDTVSELLEDIASRIDEGQGWV